MVFPARAGMIRPPLPQIWQHGRIPRESGDDPKPRPYSSLTGMYSPRERG